MTGKILLAIFLIAILNYETMGRHLGFDSDYFYDDIKGVSSGFQLARAGWKHASFRWPNATVPYEFAEGYPIVSQLVFREATEYISSRSCIKFVARTTEKDFVKVVSDSGCWSSVGRVGGMQEMSLPTQCIQLPTIIHELMHALGFFHEQSRTDRDHYVKIHWENIKPGHEHNFYKEFESDHTIFGVKYDFNSLMHYPTWAFSKNGEPTISTIPPGISIGEVMEMSYKDILRVNRMYNCGM